MQGPVPRGRQPVYSPDGREILFGRAFRPIIDDNAAKVALMVMRRNGTEVRTIVRFDNSKRLGSEQMRALEPHGAEWSPDGASLAFALQDSNSPTHKSAIFTLVLDGGELHRITRWRLNAGNPDWSPNGGRIVFNSNFEGQAASNLYTVNPDGSGLRQLTDNPRNRFFFEPAWSPGRSPDRLRRGQSPRKRAHRKDEHRRPAATPRHLGLRARRSSRLGQPAVGWSARRRNHRRFRFLVQKSRF